MYFFFFAFNHILKSDIPLLSVCVYSYGRHGNLILSVTIIQSIYNVYVRSTNEYAVATTNTMNLAPAQGASMRLSLCINAVSHVLSLSNLFWVFVQ